MRHHARLRTAALACLVAGTTALAGCGDRSSDDATADGGSTARDQSAPSATAPGPGTTIPDDFPLAAGMGGPQDTIPTTRTGTGLRDLELCGTSPLRGLGIRDRMVADNSGGESANTRELVLLGSPDEAATVAEAFADLASACDKPDARDDVETLTEVLGSPFGPEPATTLRQTYTFDGQVGDGATVVHVVPVGASLLVTSTYVLWTPDRADQAVEETAGPLQETVTALEMFDDGTTPTAEPSTEPTTEPSTEPTESPTPGPTGSVVEIPAGFPLAVGLPEDDGETKVSPPSPDGDGMGEVQICGRVVWPHSRTDDVGDTRRLVTGALGPEYFDGRELIVHADADTAVQAMATTREAVGACRRFDSQVWTPLDRDTGYDTVTVGLTYADGLGSSVFQVTRVGSALLMVQTYGEGSLASLDEQADGVTETTGTIVPAMCVFTKTGC